MHHIPFSDSSGSALLRACSAHILLSPVSMGQSQQAAPARRRYERGHAGTSFGMGLTGAVAFRTHWH